MLIVCIGIPCFHLFIQKHAIVYFSIICKLIKKFLFSLWKCLLYGKNVATYSEYLVEVDFLRIYTHINIYCKSISFCLNSLRLSDWNCSWTDNMHGIFSWVTLSFLCVETKRSEELLCAFSFFEFLFFPLCSLFSYVIYACLHTVSIDSFLFSFCLFFRHCNLYQQSRCLNNANPFFIQSHVQFSTLTTIVYRHRGILGNLGTKHKPTLFGGKARLEYKEP